MRLLILVAVTMIGGCAGATGNIHSSSEIIQGCSYIACAIVTHGIIGAIFNE